MGIVALLWPVFSIILMAVHFFRNGNPLAALLCLLVLLAFTIRRPWAARIVQICLVLGAVEWGKTTFVLLHARLEIGAPFFRLTFILASVTLLTLASSLVFRTHAVRRHFRDMTAPLDEKDDKHEV
jgi:hypothetical protein